MRAWQTLRRFFARGGGEGKDGEPTAAFNDRAHPATQRAAFEQLEEANTAFDTNVITPIDAKMQRLREALIEFGVDPAE